VLRGIEQAARVLEVLAEAPAGLRLTDVAASLKMPKATAHRIIHSWVQLGYIESGLGGHYRPGWKLFELVASHHESVDLRSVSRPHLIRINAECGETTHLTVLDRFEVLYIDKVESSEPIRVYAAIGRRAPLHATASGKAMLAHQSASFLDSYIRKGLETFTERTIVHPADLAHELEGIRERGYAVNRGEWHREVGSIAAPVFRFDAMASAALSATMPVNALTPTKVAEVSQLLVTETGRLSRSLGHVDSQRPGFEFVNSESRAERSVM
jgi:DNA-binding IclR family transcriptional regulator